MNDTFRDMHYRPRSGNEYRDHHRIRDPVFHYQRTEKAQLVIKT